jgi:MoaA/NifB/PqqE/SkfB family radical SAM enzyme
MELPKNIDSQQHYPWSYFEEAAKHYNGFDVLLITGGESTLHPEFPRIVREFRGLFNSKSIQVVTNGSTLHKPEIIELLKTVDLVRATLYHDSDRALYKKLKRNRVINLSFLTAPHMSFVGSPHHSAPCHRKRLSIYHDSKIFPCCVAPHWNDNFVLPSPAWREELRGKQLHCADCPFAKVTR